MDKAIHKGTSVEELYTRQRGECWLEAEFDDIDGEKVYGDLYCTDGKTRMTTASLLNPSTECVKCMSDFISWLLGGEYEEIDGKYSGK